jgi:hypothetical protein
MNWWGISFQVIQAASGVAVVAAIWVAANQLRSQNRQQHREFENLYVQRYWSIMDQFSADYRLRAKRTDLTDADLMACHSYLELCEDEADLFEAHRITPETWSIWKQGINYMLNQEHFVKLLADSPSETYKTLRQYIADGNVAPHYKGSKAELRGQPDTRASKPPEGA